MTRSSFWCSAVIALSLFSGAEAQARSSCPRQVPPPAEGEEIVCVMPARIWRGGEEDIRDIESVPVPASFRRTFEASGPCGSTTVPRPLIDWNLRFGSEASTTTALAYLETRLLRSMPAPEAYASEMRRAWRAAQPDLACARTISQPDGLNYSPQSTFMARSGAIGRLRTLIYAHQEYFLIAEQSLRAAEEFGSVQLLEKAEPYLQALVDAAQFLQSLQNESTVGLLSLDVQTFATDDLRMRAAVLRARLTGSADDLARARALVDQMNRPDFARMSELAFRGGAGFCDFGDGGEEAERLTQECRDESQVPDKVVNYWVNRAALDLASGSARSDPVETAMRLLRMEQLQESPRRCCWREPREDQLRLLFAAAESRARALADAPGPAQDDELQDLWEEAAGHLEQVDAVLSPAEEPARFRRLAAAWNALWAQAHRIDDPNDPTPGPAGSSHYGRFNAYIRTVFDRLGAIAVGDAPDGG